MLTSHKVMPSQQALRLIPHRNYDDAELIILAGKRGKGKTFAMRERIEEREPRVLAFDAFNDFAGLKTSASPEDALEDLHYWPRACRRRIVPPIGDDSVDFAEDVFANIIEGPHPLRNAVLMLDEITLWSTFHTTKRLKTLILQGRRLGIKMIVACQRIAEMPDTILSMATELIAFQFSRPRDLEVLKLWSDEETKQICRNLSVGECVLIEL